MSHDRHDYEVRGANPDGTFAGAISGLPPSPVRLPFVGDVVTIDPAQAAGSKHWEPLTKITGVVVHLTWMAGEEDDKEPTAAQVIWTEKQGLALRWQRKNLRVVIPANDWPEDQPPNTFMPNTEDQTRR